MLVKTILLKCAPKIEARAFGSRVTQTAKKHSDLDLTLGGKGEIDQKTLARLSQAFKESDLPFRVDFVDWGAITPEFRKVIEREYEVL